MWQQLGASEEGRNSGLIGEIGETRSDQENTDPVRNLFFMGVTEEGQWCGFSSSGWKVAEKFVDLIHQM